MFPPSGSDRVAVRALQAEARAPGQLRYQMLVMQNGKASSEFSGRYELTLAGTVDGRPWSLPMPGGGKPLQLKQYARVEGLLEYPEEAVVKTLQVKVMDQAGGVRATQTVQL
jgi:myo-inositol catabolism protein IolC